MVIAFSGRGVFERMTLDGLDILFCSRSLRPHDPRIVIIEIDDQNIERIGRWPWDREWHAAITKALKDLGAKCVYFDVIFSEFASEKGDAVFSDAIKDANNVYLPYAFNSRTPRIEDILSSVEEFSFNARGTGLINVFPDVDGTLRKIPLFYKVKEYFYPHIALKVAMDYLHFRIEKATSDELVLSNAKNKRIKIPLIDGNKMIINWCGKWMQTFKHYSFLDVLVAYKEHLAGEETSIDLDDLKDSICLVAVSAIALQDIKSVPMEPEYPGVGVVATAISNILDRSFIYMPPRWLCWILIYLMSLVSFLLVSGEKPLRGIVTVALIALVFAGVSVVLFKFNIWSDFTLPLFSLFTSYFSVATFHFIRVSIERQRFFKLAVTDELTDLANIRYFTMILKAEGLMAKTASDKEYCVIMIDVDHFKHFNDTYGHAIGDLVLKEIAHVLKVSVRSSDVVARYGGEEMVVMLRSSSMSSGLDVAEKIRKNVEEHVFKDGEGKTYSATVSLGVAHYRPSDDEKTIIKRADEGLYKAKDSGRNRVETIET